MINELNRHYDTHSSAHLPSLSALRDLSEGVSFLLTSHLYVVLRYDSNLGICSFEKKGWAQMSLFLGRVITRIITTYKRRNSSR